MLAVALGLCGIWCGVARPPSQVWWSLPFFWAAFYTKQTAIAAALPVAVVVWLLLTRPKTGFGMGAALAAGGFSRPFP